MEFVQKHVRLCVVNIYIQKYMRLKINFDDDDDALSFFFF